MGIRIPAATARHSRARTWRARGAAATTSGLSASASLSSSPSCTGGSRIRNARAGSGRRPGRHPLGQSPGDHYPVVVVIGAGAARGLHRPDLPGVLAWTTWTTSPTSGNSPEGAIGAGDLHAEFPAVARACRSRGSLLEEHAAGLSRILRVSPGSAHGARPDEERESTTARAVAERYPPSRRGRSLGAAPPATVGGSGRGPGFRPARGAARGR